MTQTGQFMTVDEVASYLNVDRETIYRSRANGHFPPAAKILGRLRWLREDIDAYVAHQVAADAHALNGRRLRRSQTETKQHRQSKV